MKRFQDLLGKSTASIKELSQLNGRRASTTIAILQAPAENWGLQFTNNHVHGGVRRTKLVGAKPSLGKGKSNIFYNSSVINSFWCFFRRMGKGAFCQWLRTGQSWAPLERKSHINILGIQGSKVCSFNNYSHAFNISVHPFSNRQHSCLFLFSKHGTYSQQSCLRYQQRNLGIRTEQGDLNYSRLRSRCSQQTKSWYPQPTPGMNSFRERLHTEGISEESAALITTARKGGTNCHYESAWRKLYSWSSERQVDPIQSSINMILQFLK